MLDPALLRENLEQVRVGLRNRGLELTSELEDLATLESRRRRILPELEGLKREQNATGDEVARARRQGAEVTKLQAASKHRSQQIKQLAAELDTVEKRRNRGLLAIPNLPHESVPIEGRARRRTPRSVGLEPRASLRSHRRRTGISGRRSGSSTSNEAPRSRAPDSPRSSVLARAWRGRSSTSCSISIRRNTGTPKSSRPSWRTPRR